MNNSGCDSNFALSVKPSKRILSSASDELLLFIYYTSLKKKKMIIITIRQYFIKV
jgi:hypothetical protein